MNVNEISIGELKYIAQWETPVIKALAQAELSRREAKAASPPNPALENVLAKLRRLIKINAGQEEHGTIAATEFSDARLTLGDLRRWVESENPRTPACQLGKECPTPMRECPECAKEYLASQKPDALIRLLLRWYYCYHRAIEGHASDAGDKNIKPYFLPVYKATDALLGPMRDAGTLSNETCAEMSQASTDDATRHESEKGATNGAVWQ